jgi:hypothetical protein
MRGSSSVTSGEGPVDSELTGARPERRLEMNEQETKKRRGPRTPNNHTTTGFRISNELWAVLQPLPPLSWLLPSSIRYRAWMREVVHCLTKNLPRRFLDARSISFPQLFHISRNTSWYQKREAAFSHSGKANNGASR